MSDEPTLWPAAPPLGRRLPDPARATIAPPSERSRYFAMLDALMETWADVYSVIASVQSRANLYCNLAPKGERCANAPGHGGPCLYLRHDAERTPMAPYLTRADVDVLDRVRKRCWSALQRNGRPDVSALDKLNLVADELTRIAGGPQYTLATMADEIRRHIASLRGIEIDAAARVES